MALLELDGLETEKETAVKLFVVLDVDELDEDDDDEEDEDDGDDIE